MIEKLSPTLEIALQQELRDAYLKGVETGYRRAKEQNVTLQTIINGWGSRKDLVSRCFKCGKEAESGITWEQAIKANALGGCCVSCVEQTAVGNVSR